MRIILAPNAFKECLDAPEVCTAIEQGIRRVVADAEVVHVPLADGGDGTQALLTSAASHHAGAATVQIQASDPLLRHVQACYGLYTAQGHARRHEVPFCSSTRDGGAGAGEGVAVIEMASASGLWRLRECEKDPLRTSTYGFGEMIADALSRRRRRRLRGQGTGGADADADAEADAGDETWEVDRLLLCIGGSATTDGGIGMAAALGYRFYDADGQLIERPVGANMVRVARIDSSQVHPRLRGVSSSSSCKGGMPVRVVVACDVSNPLLGPRGAVAVYGPQKGARTPESQDVLERGLENMARLWSEMRQDLADVAEMPGAGAAGGLGAGLRAFCGAVMRPGLDLVADEMGLKTELAKGADLVITAEGRIDDSTTAGKVPHGVAVIATEFGVPTVAVAGSVSGDLAELYRSGMVSVFAIAPGPITLEYSMKHASQLINDTVAQLMRTWTAAGHQASRRSKL